MITPIVYTLDDVHVSFKKRRLFKSPQIAHILKGISVTITRGEALGIIGANGAGKSTLLRLMAGILMPDSGIATGYDNTVSLLTLGGGLFPECSGRANAVMLLMLQYNFTLSEALSKTNQIAAYAGLQDSMDSPLKTYSTGMLSRLQFAIAMQANPDILLIDEILAVGDMSFAIKSYEAIQKRVEEGGTIVLVTHVLESLVAVCSRVVWLDKGKVLADGDPAIVASQYVLHSAKQR